MSDLAAAIRQQMAKGYRVVFSPETEFEAVWVQVRHWNGAQWRTAGLVIVEAMLDHRAAGPDGTLADAIEGAGQQLDERLQRQSG